MRTRFSTKKWFTLLEIVVVLGIIGIILGITFRINLNQVLELKLKNEVAQFQESYQRHLSTALSTSIYLDNSYTEQQLIIPANWSEIIYTYTGWSMTWHRESIQLKEALVSWIEPDENELIVSHKPYDINCTINNNELIQTGSIKFSSTNLSSKICFSISASTCKLKKIHCIE